MEAAYYVSPAIQFHGLNLTPELCECIFKHTYCQGGPDRFSAESILARSKHGDLIRSGYSHLEGQAVRIADKISYLISDLEDGIRLGALSLSDLLRCRFFHRPPLDFVTESNAPLSSRFLEQRRWVLKLLMEDVLQESNRRLARLSGHSRECIRDADKYIIHHSDDMAADVAEIWEKLQAGRLHKDSRVMSSNLRAARIVSELTVAYSALPQLIDERFRQEHDRLSGSQYMRFYRSRVGRKVQFRHAMISFLPMHVLIGTDHKLGEGISVYTEHLVMAKDYVAALSDSRARQLHRELIEGR